MSNLDENCNHNKIKIVSDKNEGKLNTLFSNKNYQPNENINQIHPPKTESFISNSNMSAYSNVSGASSGGDTRPSIRSETSTSAQFSIETVCKYLQSKLGFYVEYKDESRIGKKEKAIEKLTVDGLLKHWKEKGFKNIVTMVGAGISTSAGIPDFRSPGSGLYDNLKEYNLPSPEAILSIDYFHDNPKPFFKLAKELYPNSSIKPTPSHYFIKLLEEKGILLRHYTQNIDGLERLAGISEDKLVEAHGTFYTNKCLDCYKTYSMDYVKEQVFQDKIPTCTQSLCNGVVKPDIVFFGENLPDKFHTLPDEDFKKCDLLIIMGTSLEIQPFASLIEKPNENCIRFLINREPVGCKSTNLLSSWFLFGDGLFYDDRHKNTRDIALIDDCDNGVLQVADALGWTNELKNIIQKGHLKLDKPEISEENLIEEQMS